MARIDRRTSSLERDLGRLRARRFELAERLRALNLLAQDGSDGSTRRNGTQIAPRQVAGPMLRGAEIRELAVLLLVRSPHGARVIHYRDWLRLLTDRGLRVSGRNPEASFLTQITRSPVVERGTDPGTYRINFDFPRQARERLELLRVELARTFTLPSGATRFELEMAERQRIEVTRSIRQLERHLTEALRSLGTADADDTREVA